MESCSLIIHGGAIGSPKVEYSSELKLLRELAGDYNARLRIGMSALTAVAEVMRELEKSGLFIAGRGSSPNEIGDYELDASIADGITGRCGAVACLSGFKFPSEVALAILQHEREALWAGSGAERLARQYGCEPIDNNSDWYTPRFVHLDDTASLGFGTAGVVARDIEGHLASGTTTGGLLSKRSGRIGDSPIVGAGTWADNQVAVSCTGDGQAFLRANAAALLAHRVEFLKESIEGAAIAVLERVALFQGSGALVALDCRGNGSVQHSCAGIKYAIATSDGHVTTGTRALNDKP